MDAQTVAASSPAEVDVFNGQQPSFAEYEAYRQSGEIPARFKQAEPAESAPAEQEPPEQAESEGEEPESASASDAEETQEHPQKGAEKRIKQLLAREKEARQRAEELERRLAAIEQGAKPDSPPAKPQAPPQNYQEWRKAFKPAEWVAEYAKQNPEAIYEDATAAMADYLGDVRDKFKSFEQANAEQKRKWDSQLTEAAEKYENFNDEKRQFASRIIQNPEIPFALKELLNTSENLPDVIHVIAEDSEFLRKFEALAKTNPTKAARTLRDIERDVEEALAGNKPEPAQRNDKGQFQKAAPEKRQTQAPKPVSPVGGPSSRAFDVSDDSLSADEWQRQRNKQLGLVR